MKKTQATFRLSEECHEALVALANATGIGRTAVVELAVRQIAKSGIGVFREMGPPTFDPKLFAKAVAKKARVRIFVPPTVEEVRQYGLLRQFEGHPAVDPEAFVDFYASKKWMVGKTKMADWQACVRTWEKRRAEEASAPRKGGDPLQGKNTHRPLTAEEKKNLVHRD